MSSSSPAQSLAPPPLTSHSASSSNLRSPLSLASLGRRRSASCLQALAAATPTHSTQDPQQKPVHPTPITVDCPLPPISSKPSMFVLVVSRFVEWLHVNSKHTRSWSNSSSPRSSTEEFILPLSASSQETFGDDVLEKSPPTTSSVISHYWTQGFPSIHAPILLVILLFPISTALVLLSLATLPVSLQWPRTLTDIAQLGRELHGYSQSGFGPMAHVISVMSITAVWKHAWSIPGSVVWNVLAGALFSPALATLLLTALTTVGSACAALLSMPLAPFLTRLLPRALHMTRTALEGDSDSDLDAPGSPSRPKSPTWVRLSVLRLIGVVPWSGINIACGVCGVAITDCMLGAFIGSLPWTAVTCQIGDILQTVASTPSPTPQTISSLLTKPEIIFKLVFLSFLSLAPILGRERLRRLISNHASPRKIAVPLNMTAEDRAARWKWAQGLRSKIRMPSRTRTAEREHNAQQLQLSVLIQEKRALEDLPS